MSEDPTWIELKTDPIRSHMTGYTAHKNMYFDAPFISEIADNLYQGGCENGLILPEFIKHVVSLYPWEKYTVNHELQSNFYLFMYDSVSQQFAEVDGLAHWVNAARKTGPVLVHCQAGLNRSSLVAARALMLDTGMSGDDAIYELRSKRSPACLCNPAFEAHLRSFDE
jgi:protein-tyrosine phosphatase